MDIRLATIEREVLPNESLRDVVGEAKALTWIRRVEVALVTIEGGRMFLGTGGFDGIDFHAEEGLPNLAIDQGFRRVTKIGWHTHPSATGPSDHDREFLRRIGQSTSRIYEMFADGDGTIFKAAETEKRL